jgi:Xaa-Pro aminopeptidase
MTRSIECIQDAMREMRLDALLIMRPINVSYLIKWYDYTHMSLVPEQANFLVVPREGTPLFINKGFIRGAVEAPGKPPWLASHVEAPGANPLLEVDFLGERMRTDGWDGGSIGIEKEWLPLATFERLQTHLPRATFIGADVILKQARATKDAFEIELLRHANALFEQAYDAAIAHLAQTKDFEAAMALLSELWVRSGGVPHFIMSRVHNYDWDGVGSEVSRLRHQGENVRYYKPDIEEMWGDYCLQFQGYWVDRGCHQWMNPAKIRDRLDELRRKQEAICDLHRRILDALHVGMTAKTARDAVERALGDRLNIPMWIVHGIGLDLHEQPMFGPWLVPQGESRYSEDDKVRITEGTVLLVETFADIFLEEPYVATRDGWMPLSSRQYKAIWEG